MSELRLLKINAKLMSELFSFQWIFVSWIITLILYFQSIKRAAISDTKDKLVEILLDIANLSWLDEELDSVYLEDNYTTITNRALWKTKQLNELFYCNIFDVEQLSAIYDFDVEEYARSRTKRQTKKERDKEKLMQKQEFQENCHNIIDQLETDYFNIVIKSSISQHPYFRLAVILGLSTLLVG